MSPPGLSVDVAAFNLFSCFIPQAKVARFDKHCQPQGIVSGLCIVIPVGEQPTSVLHELKCYSISQIRYKPACMEREVDKSAD